MTAGPGYVFFALAVCCPLLAASLLVSRESGMAGVMALLKRTFDYDRIRPAIRT